ncbi:hypothetical protein [Streptomyces globisporus]
MDQQNLRTPTLTCPARYTDSDPDMDEALRRARAPRAAVAA